MGRLRKGLLGRIGAAGAASMTGSKGDPPSIRPGVPGPCDLASVLFLVLLVSGGPGFRALATVPEDPMHGDPPPSEVVFASGLGAVHFPHQFHVADLEIACEECHHETLAGQLSMPHPEYFEDFWIRCATCHKAGEASAGPQACSACHHNSPVDIADETLSSKVVIHDSCWQCHPVGSGPDASESCAFCHGSAEPGGHG